MDQVSNWLLIGGFILNILTTMGAYVRLRVELEHRLTLLETHVLNEVH